MKKLLKKLIPDFILYWYHWKLAFLGAVVFGWPSRKLKVIGVTGTKGKSTVVFLAGKILQEKFSTSSNNTNPPQPFLKGGGEESNSPPLGGVRGDFVTKVGWISSLTINDGKRKYMNPFHMTMPGRFFIQQTLRRMVKNGCKYALVEVTSEGIKQHRHRFIKWAGAVFTNLAPEHLEAHGGFENYRKEKEKLFAAVARNKKSFGIYNLDDKNAEWFLKYPVGKKFGYFLNPPQPSFKKEGDAFLYKREAGRDFEISDVKLGADGSGFKLNGVDFKTNLLGEFNVYNCAAAAAIGEACGVKLEDASVALGKIQAIPGRLEIIDEGQDFSVVVDLAHTPDSFEKVFKLFNELRNQPHPNPLLEKERQKIGRIISVFGSAGGGRDKWKRPELGKIASQYSNQIFICNEDPYDEDPLSIAEQILAGSDKNKTDIVLGRREAIAKALSLARTGDIILVLGKGTEQTYVEGTKKIHWDDREVAREELKKIKK
ncbi:MAG: UDP-N-acetylmuramoyl-L-alanyl-D-glutamate--2,6-diaminopimelate ligase [Candidatus Portnoybacteria bacterium]|jgi:UDP-N-acetylmuramoyl-L-alanyl-D-glutamate--2,6-diaminopimelate ligase|nr:UDP-N-acetylmuramoyl-L-alanyl-D-glutamate--2,6-diaminopimelate ligase [Candidatus Portnoybacteria bacterium]